MSAETAEMVKAGILEAVPFVRTLGLEFAEVDYGRAVMRLPDNAAHHNHLAGPHAGAMFTLGESASGAVVVGAFGDTMDRAVPLPVSVEMHFHKLAKGEVFAEARLGRDRGEVIAELDAGQRPQFPVSIELRTADGTTTGSMTAVWTLRPKR